MPGVLRLPTSLKYNLVIIVMIFVTLSCINFDLKVLFPEVLECIM